ncbi:heme exporter protein CcmD [Candidatus Thiodubiliella endoseptemdiera]|uniref:Heme exporter protein D n=1 Tax=Candidatus Thiodubiliella endoseptemdiera TaxID=2738886 RepID=A0A853EZA5_9GAMM|nr:heme exporter protein CcmD [Candidatus Thiodubiliella endoseptemdiera]
MGFLLFDKYMIYIWVSYLLTFAIVGFLFISTKVNHKRVVTQLRIKYARGEKK